MGWAQISEKRRTLSWLADDQGSDEMLKNEETTMSSPGDIT